jgi:hypothetical protein
MIHMSVVGCAMVLLLGKRLLGDYDRATEKVNIIPSKHQRRPHTTGRPLPI